MSTVASLKRQVRKIKIQAYPDRRKGCLAWKNSDGTYTFGGVDGLTETEMARMADSVGCTDLIVIQWATPEEDRR